jgi:GNAT superfamily N-acetyltransferase
VEVREYRPGDQAQVVELLRASFGSWPGSRVVAGDRPEEFFEWKHAAAPQGPSYILLAEEEGRPIAMRAYMRWPLAVDGRRLGGVQCVDIATHPEHRGKGVMGRLTKRAMAELRDTTAFALGLPNDMSRSQSRKVGWRAVGRLPVWVCVRRPLRTARRLGALRAPASAEATLPVEAPAAPDALRDGAAVEELLADARPPGARLATPVDVHHLRWRYEPMLGDYRAVADEQGGRLRGLAIFGLRARGELWEAAVCELIVRRGDTATARRLLRRVARAAPVDYVAALPSAGSGQARTLARAGFLPAPTGARTLGVTPYHETIQPDPTTLGSWSLTYGDLERLDLC